MLARFCRCVVTQSILTAYDCGGSRFAHCTVASEIDKLVFIVYFSTKNHNAAVRRDEVKVQSGEHHCLES